MQNFIFNCPCCGEKINLIISPDGQKTVGDFDIFQTKLVEQANAEGYEFGTSMGKEE